MAPKRPKRRITLGRSLDRHDSAAASPAVDADHTDATRPLDTFEQEVAAGTRTSVLGPYLTGRARGAMAGGGGLGGSTAGHPPGSAPNLRSPQARLDEALGLAAAIDLSVVDQSIAPLAAVRPSTYVGKGKVSEIAARVKEEEIRLVVVDAALTPIQQRNLERAWSCKVIDRTGLILEIFGRRARTREGTLQVELAHLNYQKSRLVRSWTHLERQRGGFGFLGGPGETQIEADRRIIQERVTRIERELETVVRTRGLHRKSRKQVPYPTVALVGYTNAGKSTLFNRLTKADVLAKDLLFATLDPTARAVRLPHGATVIFSDTVGFISDLPTTLVAAFRATLEDVLEADLVLHVRDVSHEDAEAQGQDVEAILGELGLNGQPADAEAGLPAELAKPLIEVWNKADLLHGADHARLAALSELRPADGRTRRDDRRRGHLPRAIPALGPAPVVRQDRADGRTTHEPECVGASRQALQGKRRHAAGHPTVAPVDRSGRAGGAGGGKGREAESAASPIGSRPAPTKTRPSPSRSAGP
jgi:GTP-binding protein HflX